MKHTLHLHSNSLYNGIMREGVWKHLLPNLTNNYWTLWKLVFHFTTIFLRHGFFTMASCLIFARYILNYVGGDVCLVYRLIFKVPIRGNCLQILCCQLLARRANESHKRLVKIKALINNFFSKTIQLTVVKVYEKCFIALSKYLID